MTAAEILRNEDFLKLGINLQLNVKNTESLILARKDNKMVLAIICDGVVTYHHFNHLEIMTPHNEPNFPAGGVAAVMEKWAESFITFIESGNASEKNSDRLLIDFFRASFPDVPVLVSNQS